MCSRKKEIPKCTFSEATKVIESTKPKTRFTTKLFFWLFIGLMLFTAFIFWAADESSPVNIGTNILTGIIALSLSFFFGIISFIRFIRARSIAGGLFLTTAVSTAIFLGVSQMLPIIIPPTASAFSNSPETTESGLRLLTGLAQVGLFALWFLFLLLTIYMHVRPVKRIDRYLQKIVDGECVKKIRIGKARQYRGIEEKIGEIYKKLNSNK